MSGVGTKRTLKLLIDTNIWLDYFLGRTSATKPTVELFSRAAEAEDIVLFSSSLSVKDIYYILGRTMKADARRGGALVPEAIAAADETAWACVRLIRQKSIIASVGADEVFDSFVFKHYHNDFEDDLILGVANRIDADYVVTGDKDLIKHTNGVCIDVCQALRLVGEASGSSMLPV